MKPPVDDLFIEGSVGRRKKLRKKRVRKKIYLIISENIIFDLMLKVGHH